MEVAGFSGRNSHCNLKMPDEIDAIKATDLKLQFLTREAREAVNEVDLVDIKLYDQARLMAWCYNYSYHRVIKGMKKIRDAHENAAGRFILDEVAAHETRVLGRRHDEWMLGKAYRRVTLSTRVIKNLYHVDRLMLFGDYPVRLEDLTIALDQLTVEEIKDIAGEIGIRSMGFVLMKLEEYAASKKRGRQLMLKMADYKPDYGTPMSAEDQEKMRENLDELRNIQRIEGATEREEK